VKPGLQTVIASEAKQSISIAFDSIGLLRFARNDGLNGRGNGAQSRMNQ